MTTFNFGSGISNANIVTEENWLTKLKQIKSGVDLIASFILLYT